MSLRDKIIRNSTISDTSVLSDSKFMNRELTKTDIPMLNVALSGDVDGGFGSGITMISGPSKHFKTGFSLCFMKAYMDKFPDAVVLLYDSEFGSPEEYFENFDIDLERVVHSPISDIEQLKFDIMRQINLFETGDRVFILIDSIGNLASKKEVEDALNEKSVADMTRAKQMKSLFRMITPHLRLKDIPLVAVNHTYKEIGLFPKDIVAGGTGAYYSSDTIWILGRQQDKDSSGVAGYHFVINVEKSRYVREKSKILITINWEDGLRRWSGMLEQALDAGIVVKTKQRPLKYAKVGEEDKEYTEKALLKADDFWTDILENTDLRNFIRKKYKIGGEHD